MNAALALRQVRAELSLLLEAIWPRSEDQNEAADPAGVGAFPLPPVLPATLDELEARYRNARAVWKEAQRRKGKAVEGFLLTRAKRMG